MIILEHLVRKVVRKLCEKSTEKVLTTLLKPPPKNWKQQMNQTEINIGQCTPYLMNRLFSDFFWEFEGVILRGVRHYLGVFGKLFGRKVGPKSTEKRTTEALYDNISNLLTRLFNDQCVLVLHPRA